jgi:predicted transcriptional regulator
MLKLNTNDPKALQTICHALSTELRIHIISLLQSGSLSCLELSKILDYPLSTISANVKILEDAGLIVTELLPAKNGSKKICSLVYLEIGIQLAKVQTMSENMHFYEKEIAIGNYMDFSVLPTCGFVTMGGEVLEMDNPFIFLDKKRMDASLIWFRKGYLEYKIPLDIALDKEFNSIEFTMEICSEAPGYNHRWKSDITMWINEQEIGTFTSPADYGGRRGHYTPTHWSIESTQYGILTSWRVDKRNATVNGDEISKITVDQLYLRDSKYVTMRVGIKDLARNIGGINIFGQNFGDYNQDIKMKISFSN